MDGDLITFAAPLLRLTNALLWTVLIVRIFRNDTKPLPPLVRRVLVTVILFGMWMLFTGSLVPFGFPGDWASRLYTAFTVYAGIVAFTILWTYPGRPGD